MRKREEENESEEGVVEDDYGFGEINGENGSFDKIGKREEQTQMREKNEDEKKEREKV